jgi:hypothetical protein
MDIEDPPPDEVRSAHEVAVRALALFSAVGVALGAPRSEVVPWLKAEQLWGELSPLEREFLSHEDAPERTRINYSWHSERLMVLLWALGKVPALPASSVQCDTQLFQELLPPYVDESVPSFVESAKLRSDDELLSKADELLDQHWKARDAHLNGRPPPAEVDIEIVQERHQAINWVIGYDGLPWDEVTTDT